MSQWWQSLAHGDQLLIGAGLGVVAGALIAALVGWLRGAALRQRQAGELAALHARLEAEQRLADERLQFFQQSRQQLEASFSMLSSRALKANSEAFLQLAGDRLKLQQQEARSQFDAQQQAFSELVKPISETLGRTQAQLKEIEQERRTAFSALEKHLSLMTLDQQALQQETRNLVQALRRPEVRGRWGELTLRRLVELAGMVERCDFTEQVTQAGDDGNLRPDMVISLPEDREIVVDVKTPLDAYLTAQEAVTDEDRLAALKQHARNVRQRVRQLADKAYWQQFSKSPDFAVLFIPGEQFLTAALDHDNQLLEDALRSRVILATPTSLVALLRAIAFSWRQMALMENAQEIRQLAEEFHKRVGVFSSHFSKLGSALGKSVDLFNRSVGSLERQVLPGARRLTELGVAERRSIVTPEPVEQQVRGRDDEE